MQLTDTVLHGKLLNFCSGQIYIPQIHQPPFACQLIVLDVSAVQLQPATAAPFMAVLMVLLNSWQTYWNGQGSLKSPSILLQVLCSADSWNATKEH